MKWRFRLLEKSKYKKYYVQQDNKKMKHYATVQDFRNFLELFPPKTSL